MAFFRLSEMGSVRKKNIYEYVVSVGNIINGGGFALFFSRRSGVRLKRALYPPGTLAADMCGGSCVVF